MINIDIFFEENDAEYGKFERVENKLHSRPDLCAMLLLAKLFPGEDDIISATGHKVVYFGVDCDLLAKIACEKELLTLRRCGLFYSTEYECLGAFV